MKTLLLKLFTVVFALCSITISAQSVEVRYELRVDTDAVFEQGDGLADALPQTYEKMAHNNHGSMGGSAVWNGADGYTSTKRVERTKVVEGATNTWPAGGAIDLDRYIQYGVTAKAGSELNITRISMYAGASGSGALRAEVRYSIDDFATFTTLLDKSGGMDSANMYQGLNESVGLTLAAGVSLKIRAYPWRSGASSSGLFAISEVNIQGTWSVALSVDEVEVVEGSVKWIVSDGSIEVQNTPMNSNIVIYDLTGSLVYEFENSGGEDLVSIKAPVVKGVYIGVVESEEGTQTTKFIVQ